MVTQLPSPKQGTETPNFRPIFIFMAKRLHSSIKDATWYGGIGLGLRDIVFDVDPATPREKANPPHPIFGPCLLWPNGWMDEDAAWYGSRPRPRPHSTRRGPSSRERGTAAPLFLAHVHCGHGRPSQLLLSSCFRFLEEYNPNNPTKVNRRLLTVTVTVKRLFSHINWTTTWHKGCLWCSRK